VQGELSHAFSFVTDITPTVLSFAGVVPPDARYGGRSVEPMIGSRSWAAAATGGTTGLRP
jgi:arylsulfatase A-like enzyme